MQEVLLILALLLLVFGPKKLPELARELGKAVREFNKANSQVLADTVEPSTSEQAKVFTDIARKLGIDPEGKSQDQLTREITSKIDKREEIPVKERKE